MKLPRKEYLVLHAQLTATIAAGMLAGPERENWTDSDIIKTADALADELMEEGMLAYPSMPETEFDEDQKP